jgi:hypothetical protein
MAKFPNGISRAYASEDLEEVDEAYEELLVDCLFAHAKTCGQCVDEEAWRSSLKVTKQAQATNPLFAMQPPDC